MKSHPSLLLFHWPPFSFSHNLPFISVCSVYCSFAWLLHHTWNPSGTVDQLCGELMQHKLSSLEESSFSNRSALHLGISHVKVAGKVDKCLIIPVVHVSPVLQQLTAARKLTWSETFILMTSETHETHCYDDSHIIQMCCSFVHHAKVQEEIRVKCCRLFCFEAPHLKQQSLPHS